MKILPYLFLLHLTISSLFMNAQNVGIGTTTPVTRLHVTDSSVLFSAAGDIVTFPGNVPAVGPGRRMMWYPDRAAFRVGNTTGSNWDDANIGNYSFAAGNNTKANGNNSTAFGFNTFAEGLVSTTFGVNTAAFGAGSVSMGSGTQAYSLAETVVGTFNTGYAPADNVSWSPGDRVFVIGNGSNPLAQSDAMVVLKNGNTGIMNSNPTEALDITGNIKLSGSIQNEAFQSPTLLNSWVNFGAPHATAAYFKDKQGTVHLRGTIKNGTTTANTVIFNFPAGYRPATSGQLIFPVISNNTLGRVDVKTNGDVIIIFAVAGYLSLDGISFRAD